MIWRTPPHAYGPGVAGVQKICRVAKGELRTPAVRDRQEKGGMSQMVRKVGGNLRREQSMRIKGGI